MARKSSNPRYKGEREYSLVAINPAIPHRVMLWYNPAIGRKREVAVGYQVFVGNEWHEIVRYDSDHRAFHRHVCKWPVAGERDLIFGQTPMDLRYRVALDDIKKKRKDLA